jgi:hypothetical protein
MKLGQVERAKRKLFPSGHIVTCLCDACNRAQRRYLKLFPLTDKQYNFLCAVYDLTAEFHGAAPTQPELLRAIGVASPASITLFMIQLARKGCVHWFRRRRRSLTITDAGYKLLRRDPIVVVPWVCDDEG